ncbi:transcriptional regulator, GntR family [Gloeothece citriformis PCC 7424]|uniref:Transcriptional regulator, GntR family n=1 Tax=Gloeothece citriformis (strain PCC 7424) TaxID=65393 RepID=B7KHG5_GLOC7|nr:GntR family transcriptional regulator [Gloeothece citriformis]ACK70660.1 transcriptional regulator, GntR family [Gloeothece citriformis PCC 7424]
MIQFQIHSDSEIPASKQLFDQIRFAIASRQYPPGHRLPSTRQLAMITGLHRNTISKVYQQLEEDGLVESLAGSGIYVKIQGYEGGTHLQSPILQQYPQASQLIRKSLDDLLSQGLTLSQVRELFLNEIDWRLRCNAKVWITVPIADLGAGKLMLKELEQALAIPVELVPLEDLPQILAQAKSGTVVTSRYFITPAEAIATPYGIRVIPVDIYDYSKELDMIKRLPQDSRLGIVSLSDGILRVAQILIHSLRGEDLLVMSAQVSETDKLMAIVRTTQTIITDKDSYPMIQRAIESAREDLIRLPEIICTDNYIGEKSINFLRKELGLGIEET